MKEPQNHLPADLKALRYLDALNAGDLEAVAALWEEASRDPELERMLAEVDDALVVEEARAIHKANPERVPGLPPQPLPSRFPTPQPPAILSAGERAAKLQVDFRQGDVGPGAVDRRANAPLLGSQHPLSTQLGQRQRRWALWLGVAGASAAACLLAVFAWLARDGKNPLPSRGTSEFVRQATVPSPSEPAHEVTPRLPDDADEIAAWLAARRVLVGAEPPTFTWPLQETFSNRVSTPIPPDLLD